MLCCIIYGVFYNSILCYTMWVVSHNRCCVVQLCCVIQYVLCSTICVVFYHICGVVQYMVCSTICVVLYNLCCDIRYDPKKLSQFMSPILQFMLR